MRVPVRYDDGGSLNLSNENFYARRTKKDTFITNHKLHHRKVKYKTKSLIIRKNKQKN